MSNCNNSAQRTPVASDDRVRDVLHREYQRAVNIERRFTRDTLAQAAGINLNQLDAVVARDKSKQRRITVEDAFSLAWALGPDTVNALLGIIAYKGAVPLDAEDADCPLDSAVASMSALSVFMAAAADRRIDHREEPEATRAVDTIIAELIPFSSAGKQA